MSFDAWKGRVGAREVAVVGLGRSGVAAALVLRNHGGFEVYASDHAPEPDPTVGPEGLERLRSAQVSVDLGRHDLERIGRAGLCVVSPGVPPEAPPVAAARSAGVPVVSEVDVGYRALPDTRFAVITGTNGKSTTTALTAHLLRTAGFHAVAGGNIGLALAQVAMATEQPEWVALEISSFQLHDTYDLVPTIGAITNLAPDHLDRYRSIEEYYADKDRLFLHAYRQSCWVLNGDDAEVALRAARVEGTRLQWSLHGAADAWYDRPGQHLVMDRHPILARSHLPLLGDHNVGNALAAALIANRAGAAHDQIAEGLKSFHALPHRLEPIRDVDGVLWINDSKATNVSSTMVAVQAMDRPFILLLGGRHKGEPYSALAEASGGRCRAVLAYGESRELVARDLGSRLTVETLGTDFGEVMARARALARSGDVVLLSPACSSYDMFRNYEHRGAEFRAWVEDL